MKKEVSIIFDLLEQYGVKEVVCSPGSRNAPLLLAASRKESLRKHVIVDERAAGYFALGLSMVAQDPVALVCTSGTAVLNYSPAVAEAYYHGIPLIIISADRPMEWIDQDDSQTIRQNDCLKNFIKSGYDLYADSDNDTYLWYANRTVNQALLTATTGKPGPIHLNIHLDSPLNKITEFNPAERKIEVIERAGKLSVRDIDMLAERAAGKRTLIVAGFMPPSHKMQKAMVELLRHDNIAVMAETISNLHLPEENYMIDSVLCRMSDRQKQQLRPEIVISLGGALVSRQLKEYLRQQKPEEHWHVGYSDNLIDCFQALTLKIELKAEEFAMQFAKRLRRYKTDVHPSYKEEWEERRREAAKVNLEYISKALWSDLKAFEMILSQMPRNFNLFLSNGTPVRYAQIISYPAPHASYCNRGVSGIEGGIATMTGGTFSYKGMTLLITGDLSFSYDQSSLGLHRKNAKMRIIVISNGGGGIFRFIGNTATLEEREEYFCVNPDLPVRQLAEAYGWEYGEAADAEELKNHLRHFFKPSETPKLLNVVTPPEESAEILKNFFK